MREIGGYLELDNYRGKTPHDDALFLNCGRSCLEYLILTRNIKKIWLPVFLCDSVEERCVRAGVDIDHYSVSKDFSVNLPHLQADEWLYLVNYYGQLTYEKIIEIRTIHKNIIIDNVQAFYDIPVKCVDTLYSCRKFFGVPDGGILYTDCFLTEKEAAEIKCDISNNRMKHILGRYEGSASDHYKDFADNDSVFSHEPLKHMSKLTENLMRAIDYEFVRKRRNENFEVLHEELKSVNLLRLRQPDGAFAYPLMLNDGSKIRKRLIEKKIYIPVLWPNVIAECDHGSDEYYMADNILPLPCDQRYNSDDMHYISDNLKRLIK